MIRRVFYKFLLKGLNFYFGALLFYHLVLKYLAIILVVDHLTNRRIYDLTLKCTNTLASKDICRKIKSIRNIKEYVDLAFNYNFSLYKIQPNFKFIIQLFPFQIKKEIIDFLQIIRSKKPKIIVEIGTAAGGTFFLFTRIAPQDSIIISLDLPGGQFGGLMSPINIDLLKSFGQKNQKLFFIRNNSHHTKSLKIMKQLLGNKKIDILFIDGDHSYEGVRKDFNIYKHLVCSGGLICFHDIVPGSRDSVGEVPVFWKEIKQKYKTMEIVDDWEQNGFGIGILYW